MKVHIDHVHVYVKDQREAAKWYSTVLGLEVEADLEHWAADGGPLMVSGDGGHSGIALFARPNEKSSNQSTVAFGMAGDDFARFVSSLADMDLVDRNGQVLSKDSVVDHDSSWSVYFPDPYGNPVEVTTYDYDSVKESLGIE
ncbi:MAG: hypothetical protein DWQ47_15040 [Acidobacteria bacterium]|nr:MAG: hypothetical protein DWQ32_02440 [Acidobacteriota bacterium]REK02620.1 MAG: hypothetical protein DWQ38_09695 [Acidobacteriota bacterium]REK13577.1 MAG: hypothetical protein DWQ43_08130 [Acidobacteriota bacterium]REK41571.1 MAG: hypothetical protein DWQ47_15040 [Acidobacteriota bacterium]